MCGRLHIPSLKGFFLSSRLCCTALAAAAVLILVVPAGAQEEMMPERVNPHNFVVKEYCGKCHTQRPPELLLDPVTTCTKCHPSNVGNHPVSNHPIGKEAGIFVPDNLPLTDDGKIVCYTCHDPHNTSSFSKMLRVDYFGLCVSCHVGY